MRIASKKNRKYLKILIVEDDVSTRKLEQMILEQAGYRTLEAENGAVALQLLEAEHADVILLDLLMPELTGMDFLKQVKSNPGSANIPVVLCTSVSDQEYVQEAVSLGINGYILKPIKGIDLLQKMQHVEKKIEPVLMDPVQTTNKLGLNSNGYQQLLRVLIEDVGKRLKDVGARVEAGDFKVFHIFARDLSSSAANLGANALQRAALEACACIPNADKKMQERYFLKIRSEIDRLGEAVSGLG